jgi:hypothetical protein
MDIERMSDDARIWIFGISPALDETQSQQLLGEVDRFLDGWAAHGAPIASAREVQHGSFLVIAVDKQSETSGCSIDRMYGLFKQLESALGVKILEADRVFARDADAVRAVSRNEFRGVASADTVVFDTLAERLGEVRSGKWERRAAESWHRALLA